MQKNQLMPTIGGIASIYHKKLLRQKHLVGKLIDLSSKLI